MHIAALLVRITKINKTKTHSTVVGTFKIETGRLMNFKLACFKKLTIFSFYIVVCVSVSSHLRDKY